MCSKSWHADRVARGGMSRGTRPSLQQRGDASAATPVEGVCPARHCWVLDPFDVSAVRRPGLLVEWRQSEAGGWEGRVVYVAELRVGGWAAIEEWLPAALLVSLERA